MRGRTYAVVAGILVALILTRCGNDLIGENPKQEQDSQVETEQVSEQLTESEKEPEPVVTTLRITAAGDCALGALQYHAYKSSFHEFYDTYGEKYFFENFQEIFAEDDMTLVNLECVFTEADDKVEKEFNIKGKPSYSGILSSSSIEAVSLGNNHTRDYGQNGLQDTKNSLDEAGVLYAINDIISYYTTKDGMLVAVLSASVTSGGNANDQYLLNGVTEAKNQGADLVVVSCHWGIEKEFYPNDYQRNLGHALIDKGADLIIGTHPHVLQGVEEYKGKLIIYSLANFSFGANRNPEDKDTAVFQQTFTFIDGVLQSDITAKMIPTRLSGHDYYNDYQPVIAQDEQAKVIIQRLNDYSAPYGGVYFDEQGNLLIKAAE